MTIPGNRYDAALHEILHANLANVPKLVGVVLLSNDGLAKAGFGLGEGKQEEEEKAITEQVAAAASGMGSLARGLSPFIEGGDVLTDIIRMEHRNVLITACGDGSTLVVITQSDADLGLVAYESTRVAKAVGQHMSTPPRTNASAST